MFFPSKQVVEPFPKKTQIVNLNKILYYFFLISIKLLNHTSFATIDLLLFRTKGWCRLCCQTLTLKIKSPQWYCLLFQNKIGRKRIRWWRIKLLNELWNGKNIDSYCCCIFMFGENVIGICYRCVEPMVLNLFLVG